MASQRGFEMGQKTLSAMRILQLKAGSKGWWDLMILDLVSYLVPKKVSSME